MKTFLLSLFVCAPLWVAAQVVDSSAIWQVDSLILVSRGLTSKNDLTQALAVNAVAEKIALEKLGRESAAYSSCCFNRGRVLYRQRNISEAEKWHLESLAIREKVLGREHPDYAQSLNNLAILYQNTGQYEKAETFYLESKDIREKVLGKEHPDYARGLNNLASLYKSMLQYEKAELTYLEAKAILEKTVGKEHSDYAINLNNLAHLYDDIGQYKKAEALYLEVKAIWGKMLGKEHPEYAKTLIDLANTYADLRQSEKAEALYLESKAILEKTVGKGHPDYARSLHNLASLYNTTGQYEKAEVLYLEVKAMLEKTLGKEHPEFVRSLHNLAFLYENMGQYEKAEALYLESKAIREKILGKEHPDYASTLAGLAVLYQAMGQYEKAELLSVEAKAIQEKVSGREHRDYASTLVNQAILYYSMGQYEKAEALLLESKTILEKILGKEHPDYANILGNIASLYYTMGQYEKAEALYLESKPILEKVMGREHRHYASVLDNLANLYIGIGQYEKGEALYLESKAIREKVLGREHPEYAASLANLALLYRDKGQYEKAEALCQESIAVLEKALNREHPMYALILDILAILYVDTGQYGKAEPIFQELSTINRTLIEKSVHHLSERELNNYLNTFAKYQNQTLSFSQIVGNQKSTPICYDNSLFYKGFLMQAAARVRQLSRADIATAEKLDRLKGLERRLAALYTNPMTGRDSPLVARLELQANDLEKELARTVAGYGEAMRQVQWQEVQAVLKPGEAAIEFVHYRYLAKKETDSTMYAALILRPGFEVPQFIPLFEEKALASLLRQGTEKQADHINALYHNPALYTLLWQPLEQTLAGVKTVYFSPDGLLHRLNIRALSTPGGQILADRHRLIRVNSTRQLVIPPSTKAAANDALVYGGIQYDMDAGAIQKANASLSRYSPNGTRGELDFHQSDSTLRLGYRGADEGGAWQYLPFTEVEAGLLQHDLQEAGTSVRVLSGHAATEESFKAINHPSPRILHLATHGFFFPDPKKTPVMFGTSPTLKEPVFKISDHPMIRSGLLLAGANYAWKSGQPLQPGMEDGILTAYEISQMDLSNTELAVLSACETGLGDISGNEGVYGLQRAFKIAGTRYLIMSLWQVPDFQTKELMTTFYRHWLKDGKSVPDAFQATQQEMQEKYKDPYLWAGFVLVE